MKGLSASDLQRLSDRVAAGQELSQLETLAAIEECIHTKLNLQAALAEIEALRSRMERIEALGGEA